VPEEKIQRSITQWVCHAKEGRRACQVGQKANPPKDTKIPRSVFWCIFVDRFLFAAGEISSYICTTVRQIQLPIYQPFEERKSHVFLSQISDHNVGNTVIWGDVAGSGTRAESAASSPRYNLA
jgi:hypothetical protein